MSTPEEMFHHRLVKAENAARRINAAPTVPKYDLTATASRGLLVTVGEIGSVGSGTLDNTLSMTVQYEDVRSTDMIWVMAMAPSTPSSGALFGSCYQVVDNKGNTYWSQSNFDFEASSPNVNDGVYISYFATDPTSGGFGLTHNVDTITATWDNPVYDRYMSTWLIRFEPGIPDSWPVLEASTSWHNTTVYTSNQVTLTVPTIGSVSMDRSMLFVIFITAKVGGVGGFGGISGYDGFLQAQSRGFAGSKQSYLRNTQSWGADAYLIAGTGNPTYEIDQGTLMVGDVINSFNGAGQAYSSGANAWKGAMLWYITA